MGTPTRAREAETVRPREVGPGEAEGGNAEAGEAEKTKKKKEAERPDEDKTEDRKRSRTEEGDRRGLCKCRGGGTLTKDHLVMSPREGTARPCKQPAQKCRR